MDSDLLIEGDRNYVKSVHSRIQNSCGSQNALCVAYNRGLDGQEIGDVIVCGGVDKTIRCYKSDTLELIYQHMFTAPILCVDTYEGLIACSLMDGSHAVVSESIHA